MAYNSFYPATYQPMGYNPYYQQMMAQQAQQQAQAQQAQPTIQSSFIPIPSEDDARSYPVAPGHAVNMLDQHKPYCYVKTMGFNQFEQPTFKKYRIVEEETTSDAPERAAAVDNTLEGKHTEYALRSELDAIRAELEVLKTKGEKTNAD